MRIIGGDARGRTIVAPAGAKTRPTRTMCANRCSTSSAGMWRTRRVLDLFAGTGALSLEALSPGCKKRCAGGYGQGGGCGHPQKHGNFAS